VENLLGDFRHKSTQILSSDVDDSHSENFRGIAAGFEVFLVKNRR